MKHQDFIAGLDETRVVAAIVAAEKMSSGEIRVFVSRQPSADPLAAAQKQFVKLRMHQTQARNGVLIFFAPASQNFAILGDAGIHEKCGDAFWHEIRDAMSVHLNQGRLTEAVVEAVHQTGRLLARHFPRGADDQNELPDGIATD